MQMLVYSLHKPPCSPDSLSNHHATRVKGAVWWGMIREPV